MKTKSMGVNAFLNAFRTGLSIIFPLITYPYTFRVLHAAGIGMTGYAASIVGYFALLAKLGFPNYAIREGAKLRNSREKFEEFASQIIILNLFSTILAYVLLGLSMMLFRSLAEYRLLIVIYSTTIIFNTLNLEWINTVYEDYGYITLRSILVQGLSMIFLFVLVKNEDDILKYAAINVMSSGIICVLNLLYCKRYFKFHIVKTLYLKIHIKPVLALFANSVALTIYVNSDITILGYISGDYYTGMYTIAVRIYTIVKNMLAAIYSVMIPRISYYAGKKDYLRVKSIYTKMISNITLILMPASIGMASIAKEILCVFGGEEYLLAENALKILSLSLIGAIFGGAITFGLNIPLGREKMNVKATILSALINIVFNIILIPFMKHDAAALTTLISEFFVCIYCIINTKDAVLYIDYKKWLTYVRDSLVGSISIIICSCIIKRMIVVQWKIIILSILIGVALYSVELILLQNETVMNILRKYKNKST